MIFSPLSYCSVPPSSTPTVNHSTTILTPKTIIHHQQTTKMPMNWTPEANAKVCLQHLRHKLTTQLFLGVLEQLKEQNMKLSNGKLAEYMGPGTLTHFFLTFPNC